MIVKNLVLFTVLILSGISTIAQQATNQSFVNNLVGYRSHLFSRDTAGLVDYSITLKKWRQVEPNEEVFWNFIFQIYYSRIVQNHSLDKIVKYSRSNYKQSVLADYIEEKDLHNVVKFHELNDLVLKGVVIDRFPFQILPNSLFEEINYYNFQPHEKVAEIGAGFGTFATLLDMLDIGLTLYINELDEDLLKYISVKINKMDGFVNPDNFIFIKGDKRSCELPKKVDKIIIRNTFHHFAKKKQMLNSIKEKLNPNGLLYIMDFPKHKNQRQFVCSKLMKEEKLLQEVIKRGFNLIDQKEFEYKTIYKFSGDN